MVQAEDILEKLKQKDEKAFEMVFRLYYPELCRFAFKYVQNQDVAEELVQELFCSIWNKLDTLAINVSLKSYLYSSVRNAAYNYIKHQKVADAYVSYKMEFGEQMMDADTSLEIKELSEKINNAVQALPEKCREVFRLSRMENMKYREIAEELNISVKTVENQMGKALKFLREELGSYLPLALLAWLEIFGI